MKILNTIFLLLFVCVEVCAQQVVDGHFVYEDDTKKVIVALSDPNQTNNSGIMYIKENSSITIPATVTKVSHNAFSKLKSYSSQATLSTLKIEGNPFFEAVSESNYSALDEDISDLMVQSNLTTIEMGSNMSENNMLALLSCLYRNNSLNRVEINGVAGSDSIKIKWLGNDENTQIDSILTTNVNVVLPANLVTNQVFGDAKVYGVFPINYDYATTCVGATFVDMDDGSNYLFYIPTETIPGKKTVRFHRVHYVNANAGILLHRVMSTADRARLLRIDNVNSYVDALEGNAKTIYNGDQAIYQNNMLVGSVNPQTIEAKVVGYTNMILYNGSFIPTSGGTLGANKAYLKVPTSYLNGVSGAKLMMSFDNETGGETTGIHSIENVKLTIDNEDGVWYTLDGRKLIGKPTLKGVYIHDGTKVAIR